MPGFILIFTVGFCFAFIFFSQTPWLPNCWRERVGGWVTQQNFTIGVGAGAETRPLTHPADSTGPPITESLKSQQRHPSSIICPSPVKGNNPQSAVANFIRTSALSIASTARVSPVAPLWPPVSGIPLNALSTVDDPVTAHSDTWHRWVTWQHVHIHTFCYHLSLSASSSRLFVLCLADCCGLL